MPDLRRWPGADALLDEALSRPAHERDAFLREAAGSDPAFFDALRAVTAEAARTDEFLQPGGAFPAALVDDDDGPDLPPRALAPGDRVGDYEVIGLLGHGGMGEVYHARDLQLGRDVALKVPRAGRRTDLVSRLRRESRLLAALNHPNIAAIYGLAESAGVPALVLELVEGPTLAERLQQGPLSIDETLDVASQIALALDAAHARGIVHRDLKPANITVAAGGRVKVLDFGLAKALSSDEEAAAPQQTDLTAAAHRIGLVFGTASYMSPEQARAGLVDHRSDIWAFGCVLYEMLSGARAFEGRTTADVLAAVLERGPDVARLPADTPAALRRLLRRCLEKQASRRLAHVHDAILDLDEARGEKAGSRAGGPLSQGWMRWALPAVAAAALVALAVPVWRSPRAVERTPFRLTLAVPPGDEFVTGFQPLTAISPDGRVVVYRGRRDGVVRLFKRQLETLEAEPIAGTENATGPFFSPDGRWLGFDGDGVLKKILLDGGIATPICQAPGGVTASWADDESIVFATNTSRVLRLVRASGAEPIDVTRLDTAAGDVQHAFPHVLPGGRTVLFTIVRTTARHIAALSLESGEVTMITAGSQPRYLPDRRLVFARENALWIAPFDPARLALTGEPVPIARGIEGSDASSVHFAVAADGTAVYLPARPSRPVRRLAWFNRQGRAAPTALTDRAYRIVRISPDGTRAALSLDEDDNTDIWIADLERGVTTRLTFEPTVESAPIWSRDGRFVAFRSERAGGGMFRRDVQGTGEMERLTAGGGPIQTPGSFTPDGRTLLFTEFHGFREQAIARSSLDRPDGPVERLLAGPFAQLRPELSPDGRWLAYQSDESGRFEVYLRPYPELQSGRWQVSRDGGTTPRWRRDGRELYFHDGRGVALVELRPGPTPELSMPRRLFEGGSGQSRLGAEFDVTADGARFLLIVDAPASDTRQSRRDLVLVRSAW